MFGFYTYCQIYEIPKAVTCSIYCKDLMLNMKWIQIQAVGYINSLLICTIFYFQFFFLFSIPPSLSLSLSWSTQRKIISILRKFYCRRTFYGKSWSCINTGKFNFQNTKTKPHWSVGFISKAKTSWKKRIMNFHKATKQSLGFLLFLLLFCENCSEHVSSRVYENERKINWTFIDLSKECIFRRVSWLICSALIIIC